MHSRSGRRPEIPQNFRRPASRVEKPGFFNALNRPTEGSFGKSCGFRVHSALLFLYSMASASSTAFRMWEEAES